ncbi:MAG: thiaminase II [Alphaproteobacteria bacterium]
MSFSDDAWAAIAPVYDAIVAHPFNRELAAGSLSTERFRHYLLQDAVFLVAFSRALAVAAARAPDTDSMIHFTDRVREGVVDERVLHDRFFRDYGIAPETAACTEPSPTCLNYTNFLMATAYHAPYEVVVAALMPCPWIYWQVGQHIMDRSAPDNPYQAWIDTYADEAFGAAVRAVIATADGVAEGASDSARADMRAAFARAAEFEWMFWDAAYRLEDWPAVRAAV